MSKTKKVPVHVKVVIGGLEYLNATTYEDQGIDPNYILYCVGKAIAKTAVENAVQTVDLLIDPQDQS